jgi:hypothetical protein
MQPTMTDWNSETALLAKRNTRWTLAAIVLLYAVNVLLMRLPSLQWPRSVLALLASILGAAVVYPLVAWLARPGRPLFAFLVAGICAFGATVALPSAVEGTWALHDATEATFRGTGYLLLGVLVGVIMRLNGLSPRYTADAGARRAAGEDK